mmetsp:Transcript_77566/g.122319  ORF Transcript_77566/g.122319 Transcript_77566/m.122319 type:complete len:240 (+) Transcript_77566:53-772(+)
MSESQVSFKVSMMSGAEGSVTGDASEKVLDVRSRILEALNLDGLSLSLFLDSAEGEEVKDDQSIADLSGRSVLAVVQSEPEWCTNKLFKQAYIRGRRCGMEETSEDTDLKVHAGGIFTYSHKYHDHDAECGYNHDTSVTAKGQWKVRWDASKKVEVLELNGEATKRDTQSVGRGCYDDWDRDSNDGEGETDAEEEDTSAGSRNYDRTTTEAFCMTLSKDDLMTDDKGRHARGGWKISSL